MIRFLTLLLVAVGALAQEPKRVVILGDSIAAGYGIDPDDAFPALLQKKVDAAKLPFKVVNAAVSGDTTASGLRRINWILKQPLYALVIELGGNDGLRGIPVAETRENLQGIIDRTREKFPNAKFVIAGMKMPANMGAEYTADFEKVFIEIAQKNKAALVPFLLENVGGKAELNLPDRIHPTPEGHRLVAENVWPVLEKVLRGK